MNRCRNSLTYLSSSAVLKKQSRLALELPKVPLPSTVSAKYRLRYETYKKAAVWTVPYIRKTH